MVSNPSNILMVPVHLDGLWLDKETTVRAPGADFSRLPYFDGKQDVNPDAPYLSENILSHPFQNQSLILKPGVHLHWSLPDALAKSMDEGVVAESAFLTVFGDTLGNTIWNKLIHAGWIDEKKAEIPGTAKLVLASGKNPNQWNPPGTDPAIKAELMPDVIRLLRHHAFPPVPNRWLITRTFNGKNKKQWVVLSDYIWPEGAKTDSRGNKLNESHSTFPVRPGGNSEKQPFRYLGKVVGNRPA